MGRYNPHTNYSRSHKVYVEYGSKKGPTGPKDLNVNEAKLRETNTRQHINNIKRITDTINNFQRLPYTTNTTLQKHINSLNTALNSLAQIDANKAQEFRSKYQHLQNLIVQQPPKAPEPQNKLQKPKQEPAKPPIEVVTRPTDNKPPMNQSVKFMPKGLKKKPIEDRINDNKQLIAYIEQCITHFNKELNELPQTNPEFYKFRKSRITRQIADHERELKRVRGALNKLSPQR